MSSERERRIREKAYELWEKRGRPEGQHEADWREAERQIDAAAGKSDSASTAGEAVQTSAELEEEAKQRARRSTRQGARHAEPATTPIQAAATQQETETARPRRRKSTS